jgi:hypothetical protein
MQLSVRRLGDIRRQTEGIIKAGKQAKSTVIRRKTTVLKNALRRKVSAKLGPRMGNTIRDRTFPPRGAASNPKGQVYSSAIYKRAGGLADLITVFRFGAVIHPVKGLFLFIGKRLAKGAKIGDSRIAKAKGVKILPRIADLDAEYERVTASIPDDIVKEYDRALVKVAQG